MPNHKLLKKRLNQYGMSLIEVMVAGSIGSMIVLAIAQASRYGYMGYKSAKIMNDSSDFSNQLKSSVANSLSCTNLINGTINPSSTTAQSIQTLRIGPSTAVVATYGTTTANSKIGNNGLVISSISFTKAFNAYNSSGVNSFSVNLNTYWPIVGNITVNINNPAVSGTSKLAFGAPTIVVTQPVSLTFRQSGGSWVIDSCSLKTPTTLMPPGWVPDSVNNPELCQTLPAITDASQTASCPPGMYLMSQKQQNITGKVWVGGCNCVGSCKGCVCVAGSSCSNSCNGANPVNTNDHCLGTCDPAYACTEQDSPPIPTLVITCCKVQN
jgi:hypothetical protein